MVRSALTEKLGAEVSYNFNKGMDIMKKICVITSVHNTYDGRIYHKQCKSLVKAGYDVSLVAPKPDIMLDDSIKLIPIEKPKQELKRFLHTFTVFKAARKTNADLYHFHDPELIPAGVLLRIFTGKPVIFDAHEHYPNAIMSKKYLKSWMKKPVRLIYEAIERICLPILSGVIYTTDEVGERYQRYHSCKIENYPLTEMFTLNHSALKDPNMVLYLGGITPIRGIEQLTEAFSLAADKHPNARFLFVGRFESEAFERKIKEKVKASGFADRVEFMGSVPYSEIETYLSKASIGIIPYLPEPNHLVCLPNKLFEYMAAGVAILASDFPHYRRVVENSDSGLLIDPEKPESIAGALNELLDNPKMTKEFGINGRKSFETTYNWETEERKLVSFYKKLLKQQ